jgi:hypothetical protein
MRTDPNEIARVTLSRRLRPDGAEEWYCVTRITSQVEPPLRAVMALKSGIMMAVEKVLAGDLPAPGNGDVEGVAIHVKAGSELQAPGSR